MYCDLWKQVNITIPVSTLTTWSTLVPIITFALQILYLHDTIWLTDVIGMVVTIAGELLCRIALCMTGNVIGLAALTIAKEMPPKQANSKILEEALNDSSITSDSIDH